MGNFHVIDIIQDNDSVAMKLFEEELQYFRKNLDFTIPSRVPGYLNLDLNDFESFTMLLDDDRFVAFSGAHIESHYPEHVVRVGSRLWFSKKYRQVSLASTTMGNWNINAGSKYLIPAQNKIVKKLGYKYSFWSREYPARRKTFLRLVKLCNKYAEDEQFPLPNVYNICPPVNQRVSTLPSCWQNIALTDFHAEPNVVRTKLRCYPQFFDLPNITCDEYLNSKGWHKMSLPKRMIT